MRLKRSHTPADPAPYKIGEAPLVADRQLSTRSDTIRIIPPAPSAEYLSQRRSSAPSPKHLVTHDNDPHTQPDIDSTEREEPPSMPPAHNKDGGLESAAPTNQTNEQGRPRSNSIADIVLLASPVLIPALAAGIYIFGK